MQAVPAAVVSLIILLIGGLTYIIWTPHNQALLVAAGYIFCGHINWLILWLLPRLNLSYGPDRPSTLALATVNGLLVILMGILSLPWWLACGLLAVSIGVVFYSTWIEPFRLGTTYQTLRYPGWKAADRPLRLLHIGDLHLERITRRERRLNALIESLEPDVIVFSGDFVNISYAQDATTLDHIRQIISAWQAPLGVYCVPGTYTVESIERVREFVKGLANLRLLEDQWVTVETPGGTLNILGMVTTHYVERDRETVQRLMGTCPTAGFKLLLTHAPDVAPEADTAGYDLYLCGHTHGGQIRFPLIGAVFSGSALGMRFVMGRYDLENVTVYTSRGVGLEGMGAPRARFLCPPEIILWEIYGKADA